MIKTYIERARGYGYNYRTSYMSPQRGCRPIGAEVHCVVDDFGALVAVGGWRV